MKSVLVIGGGGREHAIVDVLARSSQVEKIYCAPGNAGIAEQAECVAIKDTDIDSLVAFAKEKNIDLTVVGPEASLAMGVVDVFRQNGLSIFGHTKAATQIESSKEFAKQLMEEYDIPTASYRSFDNYDDAIDYVRKGSFPTVLKYDGLAAGKGVVIAQTLEEADTALRDMFFEKVFGKGRVVIEEFLIGQEFSFMCFVQGKNVFPLPLAQDHKRAFDGDRGPNTGGMGAYTPLPFISNEDYDFAFTHIMQATATAMCEKGLPLTGILYGGLMKTQQGIKVIEFNARFGDPETEVVLPLLESDAYDVFSSIATNSQLQPIAWDNKAVLGVVIASKGYPGHYDKGVVIDGIEAFDGRIYHMGTRREKNRLLTNGGRVMMCIAMADYPQAARDKVYSEITKIHCENLFYRTDIAHQLFE